MKKSLLIFLGVVIMLSIFGCSRGEKHNVTANGYFIGLKDSYYAGQTVKFKTPIATDTDYSLTVDGEYVSGEVDKNAANFIYKFKMPDHDITVTLESHNSMIAEPEPIIMIDYYDRVVGTEIPRDYTEYVLSDCGDHAMLQVFNGNNDEPVTYIVPLSVIDEGLELIKKQGLHKWDEIKNPYPICGREAVCKFYYDGEFKQASTGNMPEDGLNRLSEIELFLSGYTTDEYLQ